ncbi:MAG TPA: WGR domain-containing protein [Chloroflexia bacterium]|nr:WGR domain-containing protein [Chloroflexia bacterium]
MQILAEWAGHFYDPAENSDKIWAGAYTDTGDYIAVWGRRGNRKYQSQTKQFGSAASARFEFGKMVSQKERKGYQNVPFEDGSFGNIPSFKHTLVGNVRTGIGKITGRNLLERIRQLTQRIKTSFDPDIMLVEFGQLRAAGGLVLEYAGRKTTFPSADEDFVPTELETALDELSLCIKQALLA